MGQAEIDALRFLTDVELPSGDVRVTPSGDWPLVAGRANLRGAMRRRALTQPGELLHRPEYGAGMPAYVERVSSPPARAQLANAIRLNLLRDRRVAEVRTTIATELDDSSRTTVDILIQPRGQTEAEPLDTITVE